jgi:hypothetical protein
MALLVRLYSRKSRKYWTFGNMASVRGALFPKVTRILDLWEFFWGVFLTVGHFCVIMLGVRLRIGASLKYRADGPKT